MKKTDDLLDLIPKIIIIWHVCRQMADAERLAPLLPDDHLSDDENRGLRRRKKPIPLDLTK